MADIKISELEPTTDLEGLYTIGSDKNNLSKKVSLQFLKDAANYANEQGDYAKQAGDTVNGNVGVSDYPEFSASKSYVIGDIVRYNGVLYAFTANHAASAWNGADVKTTSINAITSNKLTELESKYIQNTDDGKESVSIGDEKGNVILKIIKGELKTRNFDSTKVTKVINEDDAILEIGDGTHEVMSITKQGRLRTKTFDSLPLKGKRFSVIGDSISTFLGYPGVQNPFGHYKPNDTISGVTSIDDTWWGLLAKRTGMIVNRIHAVGSGSIVGNPQGTEVYDIPLKNAYDDLYSNGKVGFAPDIIFIQAGTNDVYNQFILSDIVPSQNQYLGDDTFTGSYLFLLDKLQAFYPYATIVCLTPLYTAYYGTDKPNYAIDLSNHYSLNDYRKKIIECSEVMGCKHIDLTTGVNINRRNYKDFLCDFTHPNRNGFVLMVNEIVNNLK